MFWLLHSMQSEFSHSLFFLSIADDIWTATKQTYSRVCNDAQVYKLRKRVYETKHKGLIVSAYYFEFQILCHELDFYQDFQADCATDSAKF